MMIGRYNPTQIKVSGIKKVWICPDYKLQDTYTKTMTNEIHYYVLADDYEIEVNLEEYNRITKILEELNKEQHRYR